MFKVKALLFLAFFFSAVPMFSQEKSLAYETQPGQVYAIGEFKSRNFSSGAYEVDGYVVKIYTCPPCPKGARCKPCMRDNIVISEKNKLLDNYSLVGRTEIVVFTEDPKRFELGKRYRFLIRVTSEKSTLEPINDLELENYKLLE